MFNSQPFGQMMPGYGFRNPVYLDRPGMEESSRVRDHNIVNIRDYQDKRRIGFGKNRDEGGEDMRLYGRRFNPDRMNMGRSAPQSHIMGYADGDHLPAKRRRSG